jgi:hypothetical protein
MLVRFRGEDGREIVVSRADVMQVARSAAGRGWIAWRDRDEGVTWASVVKESFEDVLRVLLAAEGVESVARGSSL